MSDSMKFGLVGAGRIGRLHAQNVCHHVPGVELASVSDVRLAAAQECASDLGISSAVADYHSILEDDAIEAVLICSSTDSHASIITEAARAGKHIFCEKPIAHELTAIDEALKAVRESGVKLQIGFNRRFDPNFRRIQELVRQGKIGDPHLLRITSRDPAPPPIDYIKVSGGIFLDMMIHDFDMARYLIGAEVEEIFAVGGVRIDPAIGQAGDVDTAVVTLVFENGVLGTIDNSRQAVYGYDQRVEVFGSEGMVNNENNTPNRTRLNTAESVQEDLPLYFFLERYMESYIAEMKAFVACIHDNTEPPVNGEDGRSPVVLGKAARRSLELGRPVKTEEIT